MEHTLKTEPSQNFPLCNLLCGAYSEPVSRAVYDYLANWKERIWLESSYITSKKEITCDSFDV